MFGGELERGKVIYEVVKTFVLEFEIKNAARMFIGDVMLTGELFTSYCLSVLII